VKVGNFTPNESRLVVKLVTNTIDVRQPIRVYFSFYDHFPVGDWLENRLWGLWFKLTENIIEKFQTPNREWDDIPSWFRENSFRPRKINATNLSFWLLNATHFAFVSA